MTHSTYLRNIDHSSITMIRIALSLALSFVMFGCSTQRETSAPALLTVATEGGLIRGSFEDSVYVFKGVPYAAPPVGELRWKAPAPVQEWSDTLLCVKFGPSPIQTEPKPFLMWSEEFIAPPTPLSEDCLSLNVWSGARTSADRLPVFIWIHGGAFISGAASCAIYDGKAMAREGIVFVSINYRLGVMGFMAHPELTKESSAASSGNYGLMDQIAAIQWVKNNIAAFGGDPGKVTIGGQSAGSMSVEALVASPLTKGMIHGAIAESGGVNRPMMSLKSAEEIGVRIAAMAHVTSISDLRALPADSVLKIANKIPFGSFAPIVDGHVLPDDVKTIVHDKKQNDIPLLAGWVTGDGALAGGAPLNAAAYTQQTSKAFGKHSAAILATFPGATDEQAAASQQMLGALRFAGVPDRQWALSNNSHSFLYEFIYVPTDKPGFPNYGAFHTAEVPFALHTLDHWDRPWTETDLAVQKYMSSYWLNFIRSGNPNGAGLPEWKAYDQDNGVIMVLDKEPNAKAAYYKEVFDVLSAGQ